LLEGPNPDFIMTVTREKFESELCGDLFRDTLAGPTDRLLREARVPREEVHKVVLAGGSTRIPKIKTLVREAFEGAEILKDDKKADTCIAFGAAIQAAYITNANKDKKGADDIADLDNVQLSVGVETAGGIMTHLIKRAEALPIVEQHFSLCTVTSQQPAVLIQVYEGERPFARDNAMIGRFLLELPRGSESERGQEVVLIFSMDKKVCGRVGVWVRGCVWCQHVRCILFMLL
jgi:heat shock protein 1/8